MCNIFYESWQIQCCGEPFRLGQKIRWTCKQKEKPHNIWGNKIDYFEEHHIGVQYHITGKVVRILSVISTSSQHLKCYEFDESKVELHSLSEANGFESEREDTTDTHFIFLGYIVTLKDVEIAFFCA